MLLKSCKLVFCFVSILAILILSSYEVLPMSNHHLALTLSPLNINEVDAIWGIRLVKSQNDVVLFDAVINNQENLQNYLTILSSTPLKNGPQNRIPVFSIQQLLPAPPMWDVTYLEDNTNLCVIEQAGGALNRLVFVAKTGLEEPVTGLHDFESFSRPRFVKSRMPHTNIAISTISDNKNFVVFPSNQKSEKMEYTKLGNWSDGVLLRLAKGYVLIAKHTVPGAERYNILPGILEFIRLDDQLQVTHEIIKPLGEQIIYEFDADHLLTDTGNNNIVLFATGQDNLLLKISDQAGKWLDTIQISGQFEAVNLARPSVAVTAINEVYIATIEKMSAPDARILTGSIAVNP
jgi:hypothetical protein